MYAINSLRISRCVRPVPGRDSLWFDSRKRPPPVSDHLSLTFWVVAYGRFDCSCFTVADTPCSTGSSWLDSSVGRALHRYRRDHGLKSCSSLKNVQAFLAQLLKLRINYDGVSFITFFFLSAVQTKWIS